MTLAACGTAVHDHSANKLRSLPGRERAELIVLLNRVLAADQEAIFAYTFAGPLLSHRAQRADGRFLGDLNTHAGRAAHADHAGRRQAAFARASYPLGDPRTQTQVLDMLRELEQVQITLDVGVLPRLASPWARTVLASILADDAQHMAVLRSVQRLRGAAGSLRRRRAVDRRLSSDARAACGPHARRAGGGVRRPPRAALRRTWRRALTGLLAGLAQLSARTLGRSLEHSAGWSDTYVYTQPANQPLHGALALLPPTVAAHRARLAADAADRAVARRRCVLPELPHLSPPEARAGRVDLRADAEQSVLLTELTSSKCPTPCPPRWCAAHPAIVMSGVQR